MRLQNLNGDCYMNSMLVNEKEITGAGHRTASPLCHRVRAAEDRSWSVEPERD